MEDQLKQLAEIRSLMERSSRFISLSGLSGISAGVVALLGAAAAYWHIKLTVRQSPSEFNYLVSAQLWNKLFGFLIADAVVVLVLALGFGIFFTTRNSKRNGQPVWNSAVKRLLVNTFIPLAAGGLFALILMYKHQTHMVASVTLLFYGLALLNGSHFTLKEIKYLGIIEVVLGLLAGVYIGYGLLFWALGFGVMHIVYGTLMYLKYESHRAAPNRNNRRD